MVWGRVGREGREGAHDRVDFTNDESMNYFAGSDSVLPG